MSLQGDLFSQLALTQINNVMKSEFTIEIGSRFRELWRYNLVAMCACFDEQGQRVDFLKTESYVAAAGSKLKCAPESAFKNRELKLSTSACSSIVVYIYVVTHTEPLSRVVADSPPFDLSVKVKCGSHLIYNTVHKISQWGGDSIELKFTAQ